MFRKVIPLTHTLCALTFKNNITLPHKHYFGSTITATVKMSTASIECIPKVDIDPSGVFKYILIKVHDPAQNNDENSITIVRGYKRCNYHSDIYDEVQPKLEPFDGEPLGGGRMSHDPDAKKLHIYGYSQGYGKADHECTARIVKGSYPDYTITISDEGY